MLSEQFLELLTAFVDGELSQRQRKAALRLLEKSSEAREVVRQLQEDAHKLKQMPKHKADASLKDQIMQAIVEQLSQPSPAAPSRGARRRWLPYLAAGLAASLLIATLGVVYWKTMIDRNAGKNIDIVNNPDKKPEFKPDPMPAPSPKKRNTLVDDMVAGVYGNFGEAPVERVFSAKFAEFATSNVVQDFMAELTEKKAVQLEVTLKKGANQALAMDRLKFLLKERGITMVEDPAATKSLKSKGQAKVEYLVYAENLSADEATKLMRELGEKYVLGSGNNQRDVDSAYQKLTAASMSAEEKQKLAKSLGIDLATLEPKETKANPDARRVAVLMNANSNALPAAEAKQFTTQRRPLQPGAVQVLIKIRQE